jgi:hypothetical protein
VNIACENCYETCQTCLNDVVCDECFGPLGGDSARIPEETCDCPPGYEYTITFD